MSKKKFKRVGGGNPPEGNPPQQNPQDSIQGYEGLGYSVLSGMNPYNTYVQLQRRQDETDASFGSFFDLGISSVDNQVSPIDYGIDIAPDVKYDDVIYMARNGLSAALVVEDAVNEEYVHARTLIEEGDLERDDPEYVALRQRYQDAINKTDYYRSIIKDPRMFGSMDYESWEETWGNDVEVKGIIENAWDQSLTSLIFDLNPGVDYTAKSRQIQEDQSGWGSFVSTALSFAMDAPWFLIGAGEGRLVLQGGKAAYGALTRSAGVQAIKSSKYVVPMLTTLESASTRVGASKLFNNYAVNKFKTSAMGRALANGGVRQGMFDQAFVAGSSFGFYDATRNVAEQAKINGSWDDIKWSDALHAYGEGMALGSFVSLTGGVTRYALKNKSLFVRKPLEFGTEVSSFAIASPAIHEQRLPGIKDFQDALFYISAAKTGGALKRKNIESLKSLKNVPEALRGLTDVTSDANLFSWNIHEQHMIKRHLSTFEDVTKVVKDKDGKETEVSERIYNVKDVTTKNIQDWVNRIQRGDKVLLDRMLSAEELPEALKWKIVAQTLGVKPEGNQRIQPNGSRYGKDQNGWFVDITRKGMSVTKDGSLVPTETLIDRRYVTNGKQAQSESKRLNDMGRDEAIARDLLDLNQEQRNELATIARERKFDLNKVYKILQDKAPMERTKYEKGQVTKLERLLAESMENSELKAMDESSRQTATLPEWRPRDWVFAEDILGARYDNSMGSFTVPLDRMGKVNFVMNRIGNIGKNAVAVRNGIPMDVYRAMLRQRGKTQNILGDTQRFLEREYKTALEKIEERGLTREEEIQRLAEWVSGDLQIFDNKTGRKLNKTQVKDLIQRAKDVGISDIRKALLKPEFAEDYTIRNDINPGLKEFAGKAVDMISDLQTRLRKTGILGKDGEIMLDESMGLYMNRSYRMFNDPEYAKNIGKIVKSIKAKNDNKLGKPGSKKLQRHYEAVEPIYRELYEKYIQKFRGNESEARAAVAKDLSDYVQQVQELTKGDFNQYKAVLQAGSGGRYKKPQGILRERKDMTEAFQKFLGKYEELPAQLSQTMNKLGSLVSTAEYYSNVREIGEGNFLFFDKFVDAQGKTRRLSENPKQYIEDYAEHLYVKTGRPVEEIRKDLTEAFDATNQFYNTIGDRENAPMYAKASYAPLYGARIKENYLKEFDRSWRDGLDVPSGFGRLLDMGKGGFEGLIALNSLVKIGKTVYSPITQVRNYVSNQLIAMGNGHGFPMVRGEASTRKLLVDLMNVDNIGKRRRVLFGLIPRGRENRKLNSERFGFESFEDLYREANERGLVDTDVLFGEIKKAALNDPMFRESTEKGDPLVNERMLKTDPLQANKLYRAGDAAYKLSGFMQEVKFFLNPKNGLREGEYYKHPLTGEQMTKEQMLDYCGDEIRARYMTATEMPALVRAVGRNPFFGTFISFPAEIIRTGVSSTYRDTKAMTSGINNRVKARGFKRLMYRAAAIGAAQAAGQVMKNMYNDNEDNEIKLTDDLDAAYRRLSAPWARYTDWGVLEIDPETKNIKYVNISNNDPYGMFGSLGNRISDVNSEFSEDQNIGQALWGWTSQTFFAQEFGVGALDVMLTGKVRKNIFADEYETRTVGSDAYDATTNIVLRGAATLDYIAPGVWSATAKPILEAKTGEKWSMERLAKSAAGVQDFGLDEASQRDIQEELLAQLTGSRIIEVNPTEALSFQMYTNKLALEEIYKDFGREVGKEGRDRITVENLKEVQAQAEPQVNAILSEFQQIFNSGAIILGGGEITFDSKVAVTDIAKEAGISEEVLQWIYTQDYDEFNRAVREAQFRNQD